MPRFEEFDEVRLLRREAECGSLMLEKRRGASCETGKRCRNGTIQSRGSSTTRSTLSPQLESLYTPLPDFEELGWHLTTSSLTSTPSRVSDLCQLCSRCFYTIISTSFAKQAFQHVDLGQDTAARLPRGSIGSPMLALPQAFRIKQQLCKEATRHQRSDACGHDHHAILSRNDYMVNITALCNDPSSSLPLTLRCCRRSTEKTKKTSQVVPVMWTTTRMRSSCSAATQRRRLPQSCWPRIRVRKEVTAAAKGWNPEDFNGRFKRLPKPEQTRGSLGINGKKQPGNADQGTGNSPASHGD